MARYLILQLLILTIFKLNATNYYIHSEHGSDQNSGKHIDSPWKTLKKVNNTVFLPGDSVFFGSGGIWNGQLKPQGSGKAGKPIVISSYGHGLLPLIKGNGFTGEGVLSLYNQSHWLISNLEITNHSATYGDRRGVEVIAENYGLSSGIHLKNLKIHHIKGIPGNDSKAKRTTGIFIAVTDDSKKDTRFDDILIDGCTIHDVVNEGIVLNHEKFEFSGYPGEGTWDKRKFTNVTIRNNVIYNISKNAMIIRMTDGGVVEHNVCFETATLGTGNTIFSRNVRGTVFQYNEGFLNKSHDHDGSFYDPDLNSPETIWRYSYSHDNAHGLLWICTKAKDSGIVVRENISEDDHGFLVYFNYAFKDVTVDNNIFYAGKDVAPYLIRENPKNTHQSISFTNNLVFNESSGFNYEYRPEDVLKSSKNSNNRNFVNNHYLGNAITGNNETGKGKMPNYRKFHRGFHHQNDTLDIMFNNYSYEINPKPVPLYPVIGTVNGLPVYESDLIREMNKIRSFISVNNIDLKELREKALEEVVKQKIELEWMLKKGLHEGVVIENVEAYRIMENQFREVNDDKKNIVFYGPKAYNAEDYHKFIMANGIESLKHVLKNNEILITEAELKEHYKTGDNYRVDRAWEKRGYEYSIRAIYQSLLDKKYDEFIDGIVNDAEVMINASVFNTLTF